MDVRDIVIDWLKSHGYDGLYNDDCGCVFADFAPCGGECIADCQPGYSKPCAPGGEFDFIVGPKDESTSVESGAGEHISQQAAGTPCLDKCGDYDPEHCSLESSDHFGCFVD